MNAKLEMKKRRLSITVSSLLDIIEELVEKKSAYSYDEMVDRIFGRIEDKYRIFFCKIWLMRTFRYIRRRYKLHLGERNCARACARVLGIVDRLHLFDKVIRMHVGKINSLEHVIAVMQKDRSNPDYEKELRDRFEELREKYKPKEVD